MERSYWLRQKPAKPLFPELIWSRPQHQRSAGKLLIIGGNRGGFADVAEAYNQSLKAGPGSIRLLLPDALKKTLEPILEEAEYAPSTPSGSFSQPALSQMLELAEWSDGILLPGDLGSNSETAVVIEKLVDKYDGPITLATDAIDYFLNQPDLLTKRTQTCLVIDTVKLQRLIKQLRYPLAFKSDMGLMNLVELLHELTTQLSCFILTVYSDHILIAGRGQVCTMPQPDEAIKLTHLAAQASVWWLQNPSKMFEALVSSIL